jgi:flagellar export protein FliJ
VKAFRFRAARVLEWRTAAADAARSAFVRARESARETEARVEAADARCSAAAQALRAELASPIDVETIGRHRSWIDHQRAAVAACQQFHDERVAAAAVAADALRDAKRRVKVLERLRERALRRHTAAVQRQEMQRLDEFAVQQFVRGRGHGETEHGR